MTFIIYSLLFFVMVFGNYYVCKRIGVTENPYKYRTMDGLRGICATLVIFHHFFWRGGSSDDFFWSTDYLSANVKAIAMLIGHLPVRIVLGGAERQDSVAYGLKAEIGRAHV